MTGRTFGGFEVAAAGEDTIVVVKPAGVPSEMRADPGRVSLLDRVRGDEAHGLWPEARLPHRLDRVTSGLQVVCRDADAVARQNADVAAGAWQKRYEVKVDRRAGAELPPGPHQRYLKRQGRVATVVRSGGKPSRLTIAAVAPDPDRADLAVVTIDLDTGRYHQIRVMMADLDAPLVGDERYGGRPDEDGPWITHVRLGGIDLGDGPTEVSLPA